MALDEDGWETTVGEGFSKGLEGSCEEEVLGVCLESFIARTKERLCDVGVQGEADLASRTTRVGLYIPTPRPLDGLDEFGHFVNRDTIVVLEVEAKSTSVSSDLSTPSSAFTVVEDILDSDLDALVAAAGYHGHGGDRVTTKAEEGSALGLILGLVDKVDDAVVCLVVEAIYPGGHATCFKLSRRVDWHAVDCDHGEWLHVRGQLIADEVFNFGYDRPGLSQVFGVIQQLHWLVVIALLRRQAVEGQDGNNLSSKFAASSENNKSCSDLGVCGTDLVADLS
ncbi:hypothetical protein HG530_011605 [Fusarium avenaceum]|nr:hypothetical protein HG530_011605 [Fusarium avenaceum]